MPTSPRDPSTRRDRRPRRAQGEKRPISHDYPIDIEESTDYVLKAIPQSLWDTFTERAKAEQRSARWVLLRFVERFGKKELDV